MTQPRILIVEDEPDIVFSLREDLTRQGYHTAVATDGDAAIRRGRSESWDLILLDVMLPKIDGLTLLKRWREAGVRVPVLVLTARGSWHEKVQGIDSGADDYVAKPFRMEEVLARLRAGAHLRLAFGLRCPVDRQRRNRVVLAIGPGGGAVEDVVARNVDERDPGLGAGPGQPAGACGIDREGQVALAFGVIDGGVGAGIDDRGRAVPGNRSGECFGPREVGIGPADADDPMPPDAAETGECPGDLARPADDQYRRRHAPDPCAAASPTRRVAARPSASGRHHHSLARYHATVLSMPDSKVSSGRQPNSRSIFEQSMA